MSLCPDKGTVSVLFLLATIIGNSAFANNLKIPDFYSEPGLNKGRAYENGLGNEAIDPFSGGLLLQYQDLVLPGNGGLDIVVNRTYRSLQGAETILEQRQERRVTGIGWSIHFGRVWTAPNTVLCDTLGTVITGPQITGVKPQSNLRSLGWLTKGVCYRVFRNHALSHDQQGPVDCHLSSCG